MCSILLYIATAIAVSNALVITEPIAGAILDPTQPITVSWAASGDDPSFFNLLLDQTNGGLVSNQPIAISVPTSQGTFYIPADTVTTYGSNFVLKATGEQADDVLSSTGAFDLSVGSATTIDGQLTYAATNTFTGSTQAQTTGPAQTPPTTETVVSSDNVPSTETGSASESRTTLSGSRTGFSTSTVSTTGSSSSVTASPTSSTSAETSANAQPRLGSQSQIAFSAAGLLLGFAALLS